MLTKEGKKKFKFFFKYYSCFKAKRLNYSMFDSNWKNTEFNFY